ncbi:MAG: MurR/RpiR family transcriptional regulator [Firmicutes bacterium]|nr:MurR/RpiR family transcriptional regulator [Bacillota bacterium]
MKNVVTKIQQRYANMTRTQQKIADFMLANPQAMTFITLRELSSAVNASEITILNFCVALGYENFNEVKYEFRKYVNTQCKVMVQAENNYISPGVPKRELGDKRNLLLEVCQEEFNMTQEFFQSLNLDSIFQAARIILSAKAVVICGYGVSKQIADFFSMRLALLSLPSVIVNTESADSIQAALPFLTEDVLVIAISFPDYYLMTTKVAEYAHSNRVPVLAITDSLEAPVVKYATLTLTARTTTRLFLNTIGLPLMLVNFITSAVSIEKSAQPESQLAVTESFANFFNAE